MKIIPILLASILATGLTLASLFAGESIPASPATPPRVPFPNDYSSAFQVLRGPNVTRQAQVATVYANARAAGIADTAQLPYPNDAVIVMEWAEPVRNARGAPEIDANGVARKGQIVRIDVMQRGKGYGASYGDKRAGEWEFASYRPDGSEFTPPASPIACAECHAKAASRDFVFRGRFPAMEAK